MSRRRVLAVFAHPDDECLLAGGTLAACAAGGAEVRLLCLTSGEEGPIAPHVRATRESLGEVRRRELLAAGSLLGLSSVECLGYPDGDLECVEPEEIAGEVAERIENRRPDLLITFGPEGWYWHPDHVAVYRSVVASVDGLSPHVPAPRLYLATWPDGLAGRLVDAMRSRGQEAALWGMHPDDFGASPSTITLTLDVRKYLPVKLAALRRHESQLGSDNVFRLIPDDLAREMLGREYFSCPDGRRPGEDLLARTARLPVEARAGAEA